MKDRLELDAVANVQKRPQGEGERSGGRCVICDKSFEKRMDDPNALVGSLRERRHSVRS